MKKNLAPEKVPEAVQSRHRETPDKESLYRYVETAEKAFAHGMRGVDDYLRKLPKLEAQRVRRLENWYRRELGCKT